MVLTKQEQAMERKFAELRKKKEERKRKEEEAAAAANKAATKPTPGEGGTALEKAKAALARRAAAEQAKKSEPVKRSTAKPSPTPATTADAPMDPVQAAKRALEAKSRKQAGSSLMRPTIKRVAKPIPTSSSRDQETASPSHAGTSSHQSPHQGSKRSEREGWGGEGGHAREAKRHRSGNDSGNYEDYSRNDATLFVGDLPPSFTHDDVERVFSSFGELKRVRVMGNQCYAFVTFERAELVQQIIDKFIHKPLTVAGHELRINVAHGQIPEWKRTPVPGSSGQAAAPAVRGQHPKVLAAQAQGDALAQQLLAAGAHGLDLSAKPPPHRELVTYDDL